MRIKLGNKTLARCVEKCPGTSIKSKIMRKALSARASGFYIILLNQNRSSGRSIRLIYIELCIMRTGRYIK